MVESYFVSDTNLEIHFEEFAKGVESCKILYCENPEEKGIILPKNLFYIQTKWHPLEDLKFFISKWHLKNPRVDKFFILTDYHFEEAKRIFSEGIKDLNFSGQCVIFCKK